MDQEPNRQPPSPAKIPGTQGAPQFSRNLEFGGAVGETGAARRREELPPSLPLDVEERGLYFRVEAGKVLDILEQELERLGRDTPALELVRDLCESWNILWGDDRGEPAATFSGMFEAIARLLPLAAGDHRRFAAAGGRGLTAALLERMRRLSRGEAGADPPEADRFLLRRGRELIGKLKEGKERPESRGSDAQLPVRPPSEPAGADITRAVDAWFDQVGELVRGAAPEQPRAVMPSAASDGQGPPPAALPSAEELQRELFPSCGGEPRTKARPAEPPLPPVEESPVIALSMAAPPEVPAGEPEPSVEELLPEAPLFPAEPAEEGPVPLLVGVFFREQGGLMLELIARGLDRLEEAPLRRNLNALERSVEELLALSRDFGFQGLAERLQQLQSMLRRDRGRGRSALAAEELRDLRGLVGQLERLIGMVHPR